MLYPHNTTSHRSVGKQPLGTGTQTPAHDRQAATTFRLIGLPFLIADTSRLISEINSQN